MKALLEAMRHEDVDADEKFGLSSEPYLADEDYEIRVKSCWRMTMLNKADLIFPDWPAPANVKALQTTRVGGVSVAPYDCLNLAGMWTMMD